MQFHKSLLWISMFAFVILGSDGLRNVELRIPQAAERGSRIAMKCTYDLEEQVLYSVKWYRGEREFCRYSPRDVPPLKVFPIFGIDVDRDACDSKHITIVNVTSNAQGAYTCEVSADAPSFQTTQVYAYMYVVDLPKSLPTMIGMKRRYRPGMKLRAECISRASIPAANLSFFINDEPLRCTAIIYNIYRQSTEISAMGENISTTPKPTVHEAIIYSVHRFHNNEDTAVQQQVKSASAVVRYLSINLLLLNLLSKCIIL